MAKKQSLGKGLDLIFDDNSIENGGGVSYIEISAISPKKNQPRKYFDMEALSELASSIAAHGVLQPILVRDLGAGSYEIIAGERRWRASKLAGLSEVPCIVMDADEIKAAQFAIVENVQREDLNPYEEAMAYSTLIEDFGLSQEEVSKIVGKSRPAVANSLRLLDLPESITNRLIKGELSAGHCRALLGLADKRDLDAIAEKIVKRNLSVRETEMTVRRLNSKQNDRDDLPRGELKVDYAGDIAARATTISGRRIRVAAGKKRYITVDYTDNRDLEELLSVICGRNITEE
ncbi:MAG: ParB/RepB/Spo0J family partition protein [Clostridia bacterium]|nr:ParB/RepB/Spo0J family partition protein [Clostridia bacterium]